MDAPPTPRSMIVDMPLELLGHDFFFASSSSSRRGKFLRRAEEAFDAGNRGEPLSLYPVVLSTERTRILREREKGMAGVVYRRGKQNAASELLSASCFPSVPGGSVSLSFPRVEFSLESSRRTVAYSHLKRPCQLVKLSCTMHPDGPFCVLGQSDGFFPSSLNLFTLGVRAPRQPTTSRVNVPYSLVTEEA